MTVLTSRNGLIEFGPGFPTLLINDQLRVMDQDPEVLQELRYGKFDQLMDIARAGIEKGFQVVDILINHPDLDETVLLPKIARRINEELGCFISLDTRNPEALDAALAAIRPTKALINSVTAEAPLLENLLPLARKYGAALVGLPIGTNCGIPDTANGRLEQTRIILDAAQAIGISKEDVVIDAICLASSAAPDTFKTTLDTLSGLHRELGLSTILGIGNAGFGMPAPTWIDLAYILGAIPSGLDSALANPATEGMVQSVLALDFLVGNDPVGKRYIKYYRAHNKIGSRLSQTPSQPKN